MPLKLPHFLTRSRVPQADNSIPACRCCYRSVGRECHGPDGAVGSSPLGEFFPGCNLEEPNTMGLAAQRQDFTVGGKGYGMDRARRAPEPAKLLTRCDSPEPHRRLAVYRGQHL